MEESAPEKRLKRCSVKKKNVRVRIIHWRINKHALFKHPMARNAHFSVFLIYDIVDCEWDDWTIGNCSSSCGGGKRTNTRSKKVNAEHGGEECDDEATSIEESCNVQECPGHTIQKS